MNVTDLVPRVHGAEPFRRSQLRFLPTVGGCYVLSTFVGNILYIGKTVSLRRRFVEHLDTPSKLEVTALGRASMFHWSVYDDVATLERTWMNAFILVEGALPLINKLYSPVSI